MTAVIKDLVIRNVQIADGILADMIGQPYVPEEVDQLITNAVEMLCAAVDILNNTDSKQ